MQTPTIFIDFATGEVVTVDHTTPAPLKAELEGTGDEIETSSGLTPIPS